MAFSGMDLEAAQRLAVAMETYVDRVEQIRQQIAQRVTDLDWWGPDAQKFKSNELSEIVTLTTKLTGSSRELSSVCRNNLTDQRRVSNG